VGLFIASTLRARGVEPSFLIATHQTNQKPPRRVAFGFLVGVDESYTITVNIFMTSSLKFKPFFSKGWWKKQVKPLNA
jgi:hypothetical protein